MSNVFIAFQRNEETRAIVNAILADNPEAIVNEQPAIGDVQLEMAAGQARVGNSKPGGLPADFKELSFRDRCLTDDLPFVPGFDSELHMHPISRTARTTRG